MSKISRRELFLQARNGGLAALTGGLLALSGCKLRIENPVPPGRSVKWPPNVKWDSEITLDEFAEIADNRTYIDENYVWNKVSVTVWPPWIDRGTKIKI